MEKETDLLDILKWILLVLFVLVLVWYVFGSSPSIEQVFTFGATVLFLFLALESRAGNKRLEGQHQEQINVLREMKDQTAESTNTLKELARILKKE